MNVLLIAPLLILTLGEPAITQDLKSIKVDFGGGLALLNYGDPGVLITVEPAYCVNDNIAIGVRIEGGLLGAYDYAATMGSITMNGQYYFGDNTFKYFVGSGLGLYRYGYRRYVTQFGLYPRVGFALGHFTMSMDYNILSGAESWSQFDVSRYLHLRIGFFVGGAKE